ADSGAAGSWDGPPPPTHIRYLFAAGIGDLCSVALCSLDHRQNTSSDGRWKIRPSVYYSLQIGIGSHRRTKCG
ncbi:MAG: hypothetical protein FWD53_12750, partial [Phycisphaerales bacterium]|nr:hypothetical protein [Phycisphaerales bacterium]